MRSLLAASATAQVVISEIHSHAVEEATFKADGTPVYDLSDDIARIWLAALLFPPYFLVFKYSGGTNDSNSGCLYALIFYPNS